MHKEILNTNQIKLLPIIGEFSKQFILVGGTAIGLQIGHRQSIDFDLFTHKTIKPQGIKNKLSRLGTEFKVIHQEYDQLHLIVNNVKLTFFTFPYEIEQREDFNSIIGMPDLLTLAAMKALALGGRAKWKDYVDLYFLLKYHCSLTDTESKAQEIFSKAFSVKLFRQQLSYFKDIDFTEEVYYSTEKEPSKNEIEQFLIHVATTKL